MKFRNFIESSVELVRDGEEIEPGFVVGYRVQNDPSNLNKTTGYTATEGEGYYVVKDKAQTHGLLSMGWGNHVVKVKFRPPQKIIPADTLPILSAWQGKNDLLFEPISPKDSFWTKLNKFTAKKVGVVDDQTLQQKIDLLVRELTMNLKQQGADAVFVKSPGFFVIL